jgi:hypothetical protein
MAARAPEEKCQNDGRYIAANDAGPRFCFGPLIRRETPRTTWLLGVNDHWFILTTAQLRRGPCGRDFIRQSIEATGLWPPAIAQDDWLRIMRALREVL